MSGLYKNLLPLPRVLMAGDSLVPWREGISLACQGLTSEQSDDFSRLTRLVFDKKLAANGLGVSVLLDPHHMTPELVGVPQRLREEAYELTVDGRGVCLTAAHYVGLQRGVMTVKQWLEDASSTGVPGCRIVDWPRLAMRGIQYDFAREMECRPEHLRRIIERIAYFKMNTFHLYLEGAFAFASAPEITPQGAITPDQARELRDYARLFGVMLIPQISTLGHMNMLLHGPYEELREQPQSSFNLCPTHPQARPFLAGLIRDVAEAFAPPFIHLGYDESNSCRCERCQQQGTPSDLLAAHLNWLNQEVKSYGARSMIYGDMFLSGHDFPMSDAVNGGTPEAARAALARVSRDIVITDWHYTAPVGESFAYLVDQGFEVHLASAVNTYWHDSIPFRRAHHWIADTTDCAVAQGISGAFNCNWELYRGIFFENNWFFQGLAAERQWTDRVHDHMTFSARFAARFWGVDRDYYADIAGLLETMPFNRRVAFLDSGVLADMGAPEARLSYEALADYLDKQIAAFRGAVQRNGDSLQMLDLPVLIVRYMGARMSNLHMARLAFERGDREQAIAAFGQIHSVALRLREKMETGYRLYGGAKRDLERLDNHFQEIEQFMKSGDPREWVTFKRYRVSTLAPHEPHVEKVPFPAQSLPFTGGVNVSSAEMVDIRFAHEGRAGVLYLRADVELPHAFAGKLLFGSDGPVKVWVNGQEIGVIADATNPCKPDEYQLPTNWLEGLNDIVFALDTNGGNAWGLCARIVPA